MSKPLWMMMMKDKVNAIFFCNMKVSVSPVIFMGWTGKEKRLLLKQPLVKLIDFVLQPCVIKDHTSPYGGTRKLLSNPAHPRLLRYYHCAFATLLQWQSVLLHPG